jgi:hypothetical protein
MVWAGIKSAVRHISVRTLPLDPVDHMLSQKLLVDVGVDPFAGKKQPLAA